MNLQKTNYCIQIFKRNYCQYLSIHQSQEIQITTNILLQLLQISNILLQITTNILLQIQIQ